MKEVMDNLRHREWFCTRFGANRKYFMPKFKSTKPRHNNKSLNIAAVSPKGYGRFPELD